MKEAPKKEPFTLTLPDEQLTCLVAMLAVSPHAATQGAAALWLQAR